MGVDGGDDLITVFALVFEICADHGSHGHDALGTAARLEGEAVHAGNLAHVFVGLMENL